jgi:hypothetical protein
VGVTRHALLRPPAPVRGQDIRVPVGPGALMPVHPATLHQVFPDAGPVARARDALEVSGTATRPGAWEAGRGDRVGHDLCRGGAWLALPAGASPRLPRARGGGSYTAASPSPVLTTGR